MEDGHLIGQMIKLALAFESTGMTNALYQNRYRKRSLPV